MNQRIWSTGAGPVAILLIGALLGGCAAAASASPSIPASPSSAVSPTSPPTEEHAPSAGATASSEASGGTAFHVELVHATANTVTVVVDDVIVQKAAANMAALSGATVADGSKNVYVFCVDASGTLTTLAGTQATTIGGIVWPTVVDGTTVIGFLLISTSGATFVPGTTALDAGTVTATYVNTPYPFIPGLATL